MLGNENQSYRLGGNICKLYVWLRICIQNFFYLKKIMKGNKSCRIFGYKTVKLNLNRGVKSMTSWLELAVKNLKGLDREAQEEIWRYQKRNGYRKRWQGQRDRQLFWSGKVEKWSASHFSTAFLIYLVYTSISDSWVFMNNEHYR